MRYHQLLENIIPATPENIAKAKEFVFKKWQERAKELGRPEPKDLSSSCKFGSLFAQKIFGGKLQGNYDHQYVVLADGQIVDFSHDAADVQKLKKAHYHDPLFWNNPDHRESLKSCLPRVNRWVDEFNSMRYQLSEDSLKEGSTELLMKLDPYTFDQTPQGWRNIPGFRAKAQAIERYISLNTNNDKFINPQHDPQDLGMLYWHLGQMYAFMDNYPQAIKWMDQSRNGDIGWDNYVNGTIAFLKKDRAAFLQTWNAAKRLKYHGGSNFHIMKKFAKGWNKPYKQVY